MPLQATIFARPDGRAWEFNISGIYDSPVKGTDKTQLFFHWQFLNEAVRSTRFGDQVGWYVIKVDDPEQSPAIAKTVDTMFANSPTETKTDSEKDFVAGWAKQIGNISLMTQLIAAAAIFMMLLVTANTMAQSIRERTSELAVLKTLGFGDGRVLWLVLMESCVLALVGGLAGLGLSWALVTIGGDPTGAFLPQFYFPPRDVVIGIVMVVDARVRGRRGPGAAGAASAHRRRVEEGLGHAVADRRRHRRQPPVDPAAARIVDGGDHRHRRRRRGVPRRAVDRGRVQGRDGWRRRSADGHRDARRQRHRDDQRLRAATTRGSIMDTPGIARDERGPIASPELFVIVGHPTKKDPSDANVPLRGVSSAALEVRPEIKIIEGRMFTEGTNEIVVGQRRLAAVRRT